MLTHKLTSCAEATARACSVPSEMLAKSVLVRRKEGFLLAIVPASADVRLNALGRVIGEPVGLATEDEVAAIFSDCEPGAVPPLAEAYGLSAVVDKEFDGISDVYFEGGDHRTLIHLSGPDFESVTSGFAHAHISERRG
ncbi:MAG: hypothetical protein APF80_03095 [Alphaproteobacteria bacterium BRH_c36]|nr:MAG: hypothetical protein APF80_03095 [Alphaproteobacteria bacterium BRH_c36]